MGYPREGAVSRDMWFVCGVPRAVWTGGDIPRSSTIGRVALQENGFQIVMCGQGALARFLQFVCYFRHDTRGLVDEVLQTGDFGFQSRVFGQKGILGPGSDAGGRHDGCYSVNLMSMILHTYRNSHTTLNFMQLLFRKSSSYDM
jgi:hypothetical protein